MSAAVDLIQRRLKEERIPEAPLPEEVAEKKKRPREVAFMDVNLCFPCGKCPEFCPVQCIEYLRDNTVPSRGLQPVQDRFQAKGARVAIVNKNFGCGSSREHAPQSLLRWGIKALIGESFADIFFGNCVALGMPCVTASEETVAALMEAVERDPAHDLVIDLEALTATYLGRTYAVDLPAGVRNQFLQGTWDGTRVLLDAGERIRQTAARLPYVRGFN